MPPTAHDTRFMSGGGEAAGNDQRHQRQLAFTAEEEGRAVKHAMEREASHAHTTAPAMPSALARFVTPTINDTTRCSRPSRAIALRRRGPRRR